ncbi:MAG: diaminopimelate decarboxylase [Rhodothermales bacterium]|nr:diaminopimelate decarboxylase [Rhodothermales bacterium]
MSTESAFTDIATAELLAIAQRFGTPTYVTDARQIVRRVDALRKHLGSSVSRILYAVKANALPEIIELMGQHGLGVDVVSPGELTLCERLGIPNDHIFFSANNMTADELDFAVSRGVVVNIGELSRLSTYARRYPGSRVSVRVNTQFGAGHHSHVITAGDKSKFGIPMSDLGQVEALVSETGLRVVGVHQHIGSGNLDVEPYRLSLGVLFEAAARFSDLEFVNLGGGLGIPYKPEEEEVSLSELAQVVSDAYRAFSGSYGRDVALWLEPGRYLVADSGVLLVEVNTVKTSHGHTYVGTNSGMNHLIRPAMYGSYHEIANLSNPEGEPHVYDVVGNICESSDFFARDRRLPEADEGHVLAIMGAGAYGSSMTSEYNLRPAPAEVFVDHSGAARLVRARETPGEMVDRIVARRV